MSNIFNYCRDLFHYQRRKTRVVYVGHVGVGGDNPIRVQSMTITDTMDTKATVEQIIQLYDVGCEIVRVTTPSIREAENLRNIKEELRRKGIKVPLVADIHYTPNAALVAAEYVEKVRINPGNYADKKKFKQREYTDEEYQQELQRIEEKLKPLVLKCKALGCAMRIGTNHGSLSDRIMNRYGDTTEGMVESALEFVRICEKYGFHDIILSMKASNPQVTIQAYRLLAARMDKLGMNYPFHLGVTEAGDGEEGRIKSAVGIGSLLEDGIGDTVRVSLTEDPVAEVPVAFQMVQKYNELNKKVNQARECIRIQVKGESLKLPNPFAYGRRETSTCDLVYHKLGCGELPRVELTLADGFDDIDSAIQSVEEMLNKPTPARLNIIGAANGSLEFKCETLHIKMSADQDFADLAQFKATLDDRGLFVPLAIDITNLRAPAQEVASMADRLVFSPAYHSNQKTLQNIISAAQYFGKALEWKISHTSLGEERRVNGTIPITNMDGVLQRVLKACKARDYWNVLFSLSEDFNATDIVRPYRYLAGRLDALGAPFPILLRYCSAKSWDRMMLEASVQLGSLLCDGIGDAIHIEAKLPAKDVLRLSYNILQATRLRISKSEFISCPSCGRTLFDLQTTTERIKLKTGHLKGVKIAIMGCIVNGPGEMADADFGYVGAGPKKVNLFVGKECVERNIPEEVADDRLIELIKARGKWVEP